MQTDKWELYQDKKEEWRWRRTAANGNIVGKSSEGYKNKADAVKNAEHYGHNGKFKPEGKWEFYKDKKGEWRWRHTVMQGHIILPWSGSRLYFKTKTHLIINFLI